MSNGTFWGIGIGPGDSDLLTIKVVKALKHLDVLYTPTAHNGKPSVAETIAKPYLPMGMTVKKRRFPMIKNGEERQTALQAVADEMAEDVAKGKNVGMLTLGDPAIYSTVSYIVQLLPTSVPVKLLAGIASYSQLAASIGQPLMIDEESLGILSATEDFDSLKKMIMDYDNLVIMKVSACFSDLYDFLKDEHLLDSAVLVENISMENQQVLPLTGMENTDKVPYFATMLIKKGKQNNA
ncbi:precorrin-2 C(20)-methyltransferase [Furfurilactobacillus siliginis]|uniref:Precorrin-2 C(20)-methyltransferase n=1 Tax=Furfurilactobacillus siliginis TaxID=348151 RepID=A0A0R2L3N0_9LACO|nr:precorrin-2 C(20)-methyltransferase [Furfurilactobacillus siliginis]KRN96193.1 cobalt-precorrin-2 C(20)-methyltransferase [Furfurilactobacillus siliginis]GEK27882.1 precorrin-2 C(20)-methyltransferase [Furfurilactobacillus siliginis]